MTTLDQSLGQQGKSDHEITQKVCPCRDTAWPSSFKRGPILFSPITRSFIIMRSNNFSIIHHPNFVNWILFLRPFLREDGANFTWIGNIIITKYNEALFYLVQPKHGVTPPGNDILSPRRKEKKKKKIQVTLLQREKWPNIKLCGSLLKSTFSQLRQT